MKFNLKTKPVLDIKKNHKRFHLYFDQTEYWFEGLEKELREMLAGLYGPNVLIDTINEILGE